MSKDWVLKGNLELSIYIHLSAMLRYQSGHMYGYDPSMVRAVVPDFSFQSKDKDCDKKTVVMDNLQNEIDCFYQVL